MGREDDGIRLIPIQPASLAHGGHKSADNRKEAEVVRNGKT
jgi:hypothetical protein